VAPSRTNASLSPSRAHDDQCVIVLDEVDQLDEAAILRDLWETNGVSLVFIANREDDFYGTLDDRLQPRLITSQVFTSVAIGGEKMEERCGR